MYVENKIFTDMISDHYKCGNLNPKLLIIFKEITLGLLETERFRGYTKHYKDEMVFESLFHMKRALVERKFNLDRETNPFSYFNRIANTSFREWIRKENGHNEKCFDYYEYINGR